MLDSIFSNTQATVDLTQVEEENKRVLSEGGKTAMSRRIILGITKASLATDSFLSATLYFYGNRYRYDS